MFGGGGASALRRGGGVRAAAHRDPHRVVVTVSVAVWPETEQHACGPPAYAMAKTGTTASRWPAAIQPAEHGVASLAVHQDEGGPRASCSAVRGPGPTCSSYNRRRAVGATIVARAGDPEVLG